MMGVGMGDALGRGIVGGQAVDAGHRFEDLRTKALKELKRREMLLKMEVARRQAMGQAVTPEQMARAQDHLRNYDRVAGNRLHNLGASMSKKLKRRAHLLGAAGALATGGLLGYVGSRPITDGEREKMGADKAGAYGSRSALDTALSERAEAGDVSAVRRLAGKAREEDKQVANKYLRQQTIGGGAGGAVLAPLMAAVGKKIQTGRVGPLRKNLVPGALLSAGGALIGGATGFTEGVTSKNRFLDARNSHLDRYEDYAEDIASGRRRPPSRVGLYQLDESPDSPLVELTPQEAQVVNSERQAAGDPPLIEAPDDVRRAHWKARGDELSKQSSIRGEAQDFKEMTKQEVTSRPELYGLISGGVGSTIGAGIGLGAGNRIAKRLGRGKAKIPWLLQTLGYSFGAPMGYLAGKHVGTQVDARKASKGKKTAASGFLLKRAAPPGFQNWPGAAPDVDDANIVFEGAEPRVPESRRLPPASGTTKMPMWRRFLTDPRVRKMAPWALGAAATGTGLATLVGSTNKKKRDADRASQSQQRVYA